jgi:hypothetical protein
MKRTIFFTTLIKFFYITTLFVSSTFAFFSDSVLNQNNRIVLGNLRASVVYSPSFNTESKNLSGELKNLKTNTEPMFVFADQAQPGDFIEGFIRITNVGTITMDYFFFFDVIEDVNEFSTILQLEVEKMATPQVQPSVFAGANLGTVNEGETLVTNAFEIYRVKLSILTTASDLFNDPSKTFAFSMDFSLYAWQANFPESRPSLS